MKLSLIVPCYNEAENVAAFHDAVVEAFDGCGYRYEIVFIDDGSKDATLHNLKKLHSAQKCPVKVISFSRNFGKEAGLYAGLQHANGDYICLIDADLQQDPAIARQMVQMLDDQPQCDVVAAYPSLSVPSMRSLTTCPMSNSVRMPAISGASAEVLPKASCL